MCTSILLTLLVAAAPLPEPKPANEFYGDAVVAVLNGATRVEIVRLDPIIEIRGTVETHLESYRIAAVVEGGKNQAEAIGKLMIEDPRKPFKDGEHYFGNEIGFRLWKEKESVVILMGLSNRNRNLQVTYRDADGKVIKQILTVARPTTFTALLKRAQEAFPDDAALRQIKQAEDK